jgi:hypothetical protein
MEEEGDEEVQLYLVKPNWNPATLESFLQNLKPSIQAHLRRHNAFTKDRMDSIFNIASIDPEDIEGRKRLVEELEAKGYLRTKFYIYLSYF